MFTQPTQIPRSPLASTLTVVFHTCLALAVLIVSAVPNIPAIVRRDTLVFVNTSLPPDIDFVPPVPAAPETPTPVLERPEPPPPVTVAPSVEKAPAPEPPPVAQKAFEPPAPALLVPRIPPVIVGSFSDAPSARSGGRTSEVAASGFDATAGQRQATRPTVASVDGFETGGAGSRASRPTLVADAGFGATGRGDTRTVARAQGAAGFASDEVPRTPSQQARVPTPSGFAAPPPPATAAAPAAVTKPAGFADTPSPSKPASPAPVVAVVDRPAEILYKPVPAYTEEARARHIEGEVVLDVEFTATGQVRILRVIRGLGYGLDEMAQRAAQQIRFKPATSHGTAIDTRTTLTIVFRLT